MRQVTLGATGARISALVYGTMSFGGDADEAESARLYAACRDAGIDMFDCANIYNGGRAEEILGRLVAHERDAVLIASKVGMQPSGLSRRAIMQEAEASLRRLGTDRIDLYYLHAFRPETRIGEVLRALDDLVRQGRVVWLGVSNWAAWQIALALGRQAAEGLARFDVIQPMYNLVKRQAEVEILPLAADQGLAVLPYNPLGGGVLSGKYLEPGADRGRLDAMEIYARRYSAPWVPEAVRAFVTFCRENGHHPVTLANAWVMAHPAVTAPIIGARNVEQLRPALAAADFAMTPDLYRALCDLTPAPPPATDRLEERG
ncbi:MAG: aldo/keto reductase [Alphaproteobacteria bacterium]|nr:MAG: aldo/keto reductase [Alphaproteobacteria bacterium]